MGTINMTFGGAGEKMPVGSSGLRRIEETIDIADVLTAKGSALAATDVIQVLDIPAYVFVTNVMIYIDTAFNATAVTLDVGTALDADQWVDGVDATSAGAGTPIDTAEAFFTAADTIDVTIATLTGTLSKGKMHVIALVKDLTR